MEFGRYVKKRVRTFAIWIIPLLIGMEFLNHWGIYNYKVQIREHTSAITGEYVKSIEKDMDSLNQEMKKILLNYDYMHPVEKGGLERQWAMIKIGDVLWDFMLEKYEPFRCFLLVDDCSEYIELDGYVYRDSNYRQFQEEVQKWIKDNYHNNQGDCWRVITVEDEVYFFSYYVSGKQAIGAWIKGTELISLVEQTGYDNSGVRIEDDEQNVIVHNENDKWDRESKKELLWWTTKDVLVSVPFLHDQYRIVFQIDAGNYVEGLSRMQVILMCMTGITLLVVFLLLYVSR